jgi:two-component system cell cycle sensor histidine kinase/response regulator CckA
MALPNNWQSPFRHDLHLIGTTNETLSAIVEHAPDMIALIEPEGIIRYVNAHTEAVLGHPKSSVESHNIFEFIHPEDADRAAKEFANTLSEAGERIPSVLRLRDSNGTWVPLEIIANNQLDNDKIQAVVFTARDLRFRREIESAIHRINLDDEPGASERVTELAKINAELRIENQTRRQVEIRLRQTVSLLNATLDSTADGILVISNDGRVTSCNRKFMRMWGLACDSAIGTEDKTLLAQVIAQLQSPDDFLDKIRALYADRTAASSDVLHFKDGRVFERYSQPQELDGQIVGRVWSFRDVTRARNLEAELRQSQKMEALGRLAGGIAHDFNNLLMLISGYANQLLEDPSFGRGHSTIEQILRISKRAASVTRQLLVFSRKLPDVPVAADLNGIVQDVESMVRRLLSEQIELQVVSVDEPLPVYVDTSQIQLAVMNLVINAQDAMPSGGLLSIGTVAETVVDDKGESRYAVMTVSDTGEGMTPEVQAHIFEPFFTTKQLGKGTGLGLPTVFGIVERAGGFIKVESALGHGTTFLVYLPFSAAGAAQKSSRSPIEQVRGGSETVLLAEDEEGIRAMTRAYLEGLGYRVLEACNGAEAIARSQAFSGPIDIVISDILMPGVRGDVAVEEIRKYRPGIKTIFVSGYSDQNVEGAENEMLYKPFDFPELGRRIRALLDTQ